ncbi:MAG TPA: transposase [Pseudomonadales bacterium]
MARPLERQGLLIRGPDRAFLDLEPGEAFDQLVGASIHYRIAIDPNAGKKALTLRTVPAQPEPFASTLLAKQPGFSLHAATCCEASQRDKLEKVCRYITRPAIANERLSTSERVQIVSRFKQPFHDGATHGVFAPNCRHRESVVPKRKTTEEKTDIPLAPMTWIQRLKRMFSIDIETCPKCGGRLRVIACIEDPDVVATILEHVRAPEATEPSQPRAPPQPSGRFDTPNQDRLL